MSSGGQEKLRNIPGTEAHQQLWHVVWTTFGEWPPHDERGDWAPLAEFYSPTIAAGLVMPFGPLQSRYAGQSRGAVTLSKEDATSLHEWLLKLTSEGGDRTAGGQPVLAAAFMPMQANVLLRCRRDRLRQVVGRIKSRLATLLLFEPRWSNSGRHIWGKGFWAAEILDDDIARQAKGFIEALSGIGPRVRS